MKWEKRPNVRRYEHLEYVDCPRCGLDTMCTHEDNEDGDCTEKDCPLWDGKKWKKED